MLGAFFVTLVRTLAKWNLSGQEKARPFVVAIIGVFLDLEFKPDTFDHPDE